MSELIIRKAGGADAPILGDIHAESWKSAYRGIVPDGYLDQLDGKRWLEPLTEWMKSGVLSVWLLEEEQPVGCVSCGAGREAGYENRGEIVSLYLYPEFFGGGKGAVLMEKALSELEGQGYESVYLWVLEENARARRFYEKQGFVWNGDVTEIEIEGKRLREVRYERKIGC